MIVIHTAGYMVFSTNRVDFMEVSFIFKSMFVSCRTVPNKWLWDKTDRAIIATATAQNPIINP